MQMLTFQKGYLSLPSRRSRRPQLEWLKVLCLAFPLFGAGCLDEGDPSPDPSEAPSQVPTPKGDDDTAVPPTSTPTPSTPSLEPQTPTQEPDTPTSSPVTPTLEPQTPTPEPITPTPVPDTPPPTPLTPTPTPLPDTDLDNDGFLSTKDGGTDCNDLEPAINPSALETCDQIDNNCDGRIDEDLLTIYFADDDGDGYGNSNIGLSACEQPDNTSALGGDCNDGDPAISPSALEQCDEIDNNCSGVIDEGVTPTWYLDADGDTYGDAALPLEACEALEDTVENADDCDDERATVYPDAPETCNGLDDDCDGMSDEDDAVDAVPFYADVDGDGYGDPSSWLLSCLPPADHTEDATDCDDEDDAVNPAADELCNGLDDDCDALTDESDAIDASLYFSDADHDGHGAADTAAPACTQSEGTVLLGDDCNDATEVAYPGAVEVCDQWDNDCDGTVDEGDALDATPYYPDTDLDGYGDPEHPTPACSQPPLFFPTAGDCNDGDDAIHPSALEVCDGIDNDCSGAVDDGLTPPLAALQAGVCEGAAQNCTGGVWREPDYALLGDFEEVESSCDNLDNDCNGAVDEVDQDEDGALLCTGEDCNDLDPLVYPGASEDSGAEPGVGDGVDNDCDGAIDEELYYGSGLEGVLVVDSGETVGIESVGGGCSRVSALSASSATIESSTLFEAGDRALLLNVLGSSGATSRVGTWELLDVADVAGTTVTFLQPIDRVYGASSNDSLSGQMVSLYRVPQFEDVSISGTLTARGFDGTCGGVVAFLARGVVEITGEVDTSALGYSGGPRNTTYNSTGQQGSSVAGPGQKTCNANLGGAGGGGLQTSTCSNCEGTGGGGGHGTRGQDGQQANPSLGFGGVGGTPYGVANLSLLTMGSGGGAGALDDSSEKGIGGAGGAGGGIIFIRAPTVSLAGSMTSRGQDGEVGCAEFTNWCGTATSGSSPSEGEPGGGGAGGSIFLVAGSLSVTGTPLVATGGSGQLSGSSWKRTSGNGGDGIVRLDYDDINGNAAGSSEALNAGNACAQPVPGIQGIPSP